MLKATHTIRKVEVEIWDRYKFLIPVIYFPKLVRDVIRIKKNLGDRNICCSHAFIVEQHPIT